MQEDSPAKADTGSLTETAQDVYKRVMRDLVAPGLRELGFTGSYTRNFWIDQGDYTGFFWVQKNRHNTDAEVDFWVHLGAVHGPSNALYWRYQLHELIPGMTEKRWTITAGGPPEPTAYSVLDGFRRFGWPALQAALDSPGIPADPEARWARTFTRPGVSDWDDQPPDLGRIAWALTPTGQPADQWFAWLDDESHGGRSDALRMIAERAAGDPRTLPVLLDRLEHDPSHSVRRHVLRLLALRASDVAIRHALHDAADQDENLYVRWGARYALRLAESP